MAHNGLNGKTVSETQLLAKLAIDGEVDFQGDSVAGQILTKLLRAHVAKGPPKSFIFKNLTIRGDVVLDQIGEYDNPIGLNFIQCTLEGVFRARFSKWQQLVFAHTTVKHIDLFGASVSKNLLLENVQSTGALALTQARIGQILGLTNSSFAGTDEYAAIELTDAEIGSDVRAGGTKLKGLFRARRIHIGGDLIFEGANITATSTANQAVDLAACYIKGNVRFGLRDDIQFVAKGRVHMDSADIGFLSLKSASLDGRGQPCFIADRLRVRDTVDMTGLLDRNGPALSAKGQMRFGSAIVDGQIQITAASITAPEPALLLYGAKIGGDLTIGNDGVKTEIEGGINAVSMQVGNRIIFTNCSISKCDTAVGMRHANAGEFVAHDLHTIGAVRLDSTNLDGVSVENSTFKKPPYVSQEGDAPELYAYAQDALFELNHAELRRDFRLENVVMSGGDLRFSGAIIGGGVRFNRFDILDTPPTAMIAQQCKINGGFQIVGSPDNLSQFDGNLSFMGSDVAGDLTLVDLQIGAPESNADVIMRSASIGETLTTVRCVVYGQFCASAVDAGEMLFHSSQFARPDKIAFDIRGARVNGIVEFATTELGRNNCRIDGIATAEGLQANAFRIFKLHLAPKTKLGFSSMKIVSRIDLHDLIAEGDGVFDISGSSTPIIYDSIDDVTDSWGGGKLSLILDGLSYEQLIDPSGARRDDAYSISIFREKWLARASPDRKSRSYRQLAKVLHEQGLYEASRRMLVKAFDHEGSQRPTFFGKALSFLFGLFFGHGLSASRAFATLGAFWLIGVLGTHYLLSHDMLVVTPDRAENKVISCGNQIDPLLYSADLMLPIVDLGYESRCEVGQGNAYDKELKFFVNGVSDVSIPAWLVARFLSVIYVLVGWVIVSLAIATWSGIFRRAGRE